MSAPWYTNSLIQALAAFAVMAALDYAWVRYTRIVVEGRATQAATWAASLQVLTCVNTILYTGDPWTIPGVIAGAFVGTYMGARKLH
jgi:hypothetical protein